MALFNPPKEVNGIPLSERSRHLLYAPIEWLTRPKSVFFASPFREGGWVREMFEQKPVFMGWDIGSGEYETRWDARKGHMVTIGPESIEKRRRWNEMRSRIDRKFAAENPAWSASPHKD